jgi:hypothetical protein
MFLYLFMLYLNCEQTLQKRLNTVTYVLAPWHRTQRFITAFVRARTVTCNVA